MTYVLHTLSLVTVILPNLFFFVCACTRDSISNNHVCHVLEAQFTHFIL
jgi:hypothetical protein